MAWTFVEGLEAFQGMSWALFSLERVQGTPKGPLEDPLERPMGSKGLRRDELGPPKTPRDLPRGPPGTPRDPPGAPKRSPGDPPERPFWTPVKKRHSLKNTSLFFSHFLSFLSRIWGPPKIGGPPFRAKTQSNSEKSLKFQILDFLGKRRFFNFSWKKKSDFSAPRRRPTIHPSIGFIKFHEISCFFHLFVLERKSVEPCARG